MTATAERFRSRCSFAGSACALGGFLVLGVLLAPSLAGRLAFVPADYWIGSVPFAFDAPPGWRDFRSNALLGDPAILYPPQLWVLREALARGELALWNRWVRTGEAMLGSGQSGPLAPTTWPILVLPWPLGFAWAAWLRFGLLWLGAYRFGRALGLGRPGALAVAAGFCCAPLFAVHFEQLPRASAHVALPWILLAVERIAARSSAGPRATVRAALPLAPWSAFALLAGYPPAALTVLFGAGLYAAIRLPWTPGAPALGKRAVVAIALVLGVALAAPVILPFADALRDSATLADRSEGGQWTLPARALRLLFDPHAFGSPFARSPQPWNGPENFEEAQQYLGLVPWALLLYGLPAIGRLAPADRLRAAGLAALVAVSGSLAFGAWPLHALLTAVPPFSVNSNPRLLFLAQIAVAALAMLLATRRSAFAHRTRRGFPLAAALCSGLGLALVALAGIDPHPARPWIALGAAVALVAALHTARTPAQRRLAALLTPALWLADAGSVYAYLHPQVPASWADPARAVASLPPPLRAEPEPRVAFERVTPPNLPALFGVEDVRAYSFPSPLRYDRYAYEVMGVQAALNLLPDDLAKLSVLAGLERSCAHWLLTTRHYEGSPLAARVDRAWERNRRLFLYRLRRASPCAAWHAVDAVTRVPDLDAAVAALRGSLGGDLEEIFVETGDASLARNVAAPLETPLVWRGANAVSLEVPAAGRTRDGWLVVRISHDAGWTARDERGAPLRVVPAQVRFLAIEVPAGTERVELRYAPARWQLAWSVAGAACVVFAISAVWVRRA